jgi:hypothetical protein
MSTKSYIPVKEEYFKDWSFNFKTVLSDYGAEDYMPPAVYHELMRLGDDYDKKFAITENPKTRTSVTIKERQESRKVYEKFIRDTVQTYLIRNPQLTDAQRIAIGIPVHKTTHTPVPKPISWPVVQVDINTIRNIILRFIDSISGKRAKPFGVSGAVIRYAVLANPPVDISELNETLLDTQSPCELTFDESQRGLRLYYCLAWQNTRGEKGPWTEIESTIIP